MADEKNTNGRDPIDDLVEEITGNVNWDDPEWQSVIPDWQDGAYPWETEGTEQLEAGTVESGAENAKPESSDGADPQSGEPGLEETLVMPEQKLVPTVGLDPAGQSPAGPGPTGPDPGQSGKKPRKRLPENIAESIIYAGGILLISFIIATIGWRWANDVLALSKTETKVSVTVEKGESINDIADELQEKGLINYKYLFKMFATMTGKASKVTAGSYELSTEMDYSALLNNIGSSSAYRETVTVTIPEGYTVKEVFKLMDDKGVCDYDALMHSAKTDKFNFDFLKDVKAVGAERLEGYLFPDTYEFYKGTPAKSVISKMLYNFSTRFTKKMDAEMQLLGRNKNEIIIIASIIEKETDGSDQNDIASVLYNRLNKTWAPTKGYLQVDSTIQYLLEKRKEMLSQEDLSINSPYNTYLHPGLPVGAICNPGLTTIQAALEPHQTNYYYFMLGNDGKTHFFQSQRSFLTYKAQQLADKENKKKDTTKQ